MATCRIGTSGFQYDHWRDRFYPPGLPRKCWLQYYVRHFDTVEINNTFYGLPKAEVFTTWREAAPPGFRYALKFSRYGTHMKRLRDPRASLDIYLEHAENLKRHLGPVLVQLPPHWHVDVRRLDAFLDAASRRHRWSVELRDPSWCCAEVYAVLRSHNVALCQHDMLGAHSRIVTADWVYMRFHGPGATGRIGGRYTPQALTAHARRIAGYLSRGLDVYAYFNNDERAYAVRNAQDLRRFVDNAIQHREDIGNR
jgi:uncharacterized protein YecE (DUF72 family)